MGKPLLHFLAHIDLYGSFNIDCGIFLCPPRQHSCLDTGQVVLCHLLQICIYIILDQDLRSGSRLTHLTYIFWKLPVFFRISPFDQFHLPTSLLFLLHGNTEPVPFLTKPVDRAAHFIDKKGPGTCSRTESCSRPAALCFLQ